MNSLFVYESYSYTKGVNFKNINYGTGREITTDLIESCVATMNPELIAYTKEKIKSMHTRKAYYPFQDYLITTCYSKYSIERNSTPRQVIKKYHKQKNSTEFINTLCSLETIYENIISKYQEGWCVNKKGIVVSNYCSSPSLSNTSTNRLPFPNAKNMNPDAFTVVEYFIQLQKLHANWKIPEEIKLFIERYEALSLLES